MARPNSQSVTTVPCTCGYLERCANDPNSPFIFDETLNEYHFTFKIHDRDAELMIYHCPWCGGVASDSHRGSLFHDLKTDSCDEICEKTASCNTLDEVISILGAPDDDGFTDITHKEKDGRSPRVDRVRRITFHRLYDEMSVSFEQRVGGSIALTFIPKPLEKAR